LKEHRSMSISCGPWLRLALLSAGVQILVAQNPPQGSNPIERKVNCDQGQTIGAAVDNLETYKSYIIKISGTCNENVQVSNYEGVSLQLTGDPTAVVNGVGGNRPVIGVDNSRRVQIINLTINAASNPNGNNAGLQFGNCLPCNVGNVTVNTSNGGILWFATRGSLGGSRVNVTGSATGVMLQGSSELVWNSNRVTGDQGQGTGLLVDQSSTIRMGGTPAAPTVIEGFETGIQVRNSGSLLSLGCGPSPGSCTQLNHNGTGATVTGAHANLAALAVNMSDGEGLRVTGGSNVTFGPSSSVTNGGNGIVVLHNSHISIVSAGGLVNTVTGNVGRGLAVGSHSTARFFGPPSTVTNVACDVSSRITGTGSVSPAIPIASCADQHVDSDPIP
jgi:hypothetical protein